MNKNLGIGILVLCFSCPAVNLGLAAEGMQVTPMVVPAYEIQELTRQMLDRDRQNRDKEIEIQGLIEENNKLTRDTLAHQEDEGLRKINQVMLSYRNALYSRDQARIMANSERRYSRYGDLIALTEDMDATSGVRGDLESKSGLLADKFQMLTELENEMTALNEKLKGEGAAAALNQKEKIIEGYKEIAQEQQDKIQMLVGRLDEMDRKISRFDEIIAQKDHQIAQLKENLAMAQREASSKQEQFTVQLSRKQGQVDLLKSELENKINELSQKEQMERLKTPKDESIRWLNQVLAATKNKAEYYELTSQMDQLTQLSQQQSQEDLLQAELKNKIAQEKSQRVLEYQIRAQSDQMTLMMSVYQKKLEAKDNAYNEQLRQVLSFKNYQARMEEQIADLNTRLQEKEAQIVKIKKDMYDLQELTAVKDRYLQAKELSLSMIQRGTSSTPNSDEYAKEFKAQSQEFQSLKIQLKNAYEEIARLKERPTKSAPQDNDNALSKGDRLREKLKQALDEIDEQGRVINVLAQKLRDAGQSVDLSQYFTRQ